jgi:hypothetical protein
VESFGEVFIQKAAKVVKHGNANVNHNTLALKCKISIAVNLQK